MKNGSLSAVFAGLMVACAATTAAKAQSSETAVYLGLNFTVGEPDFDPRVALGVQRLHINASGLTSGIDFGLRLDPRSNMRIEDIRLSTVVGVERAQMGLGIGYSFARQSEFGTLSLQAMSARVGVDGHGGPEGPVLWAELLPLRLASRTSD
jgi:hypothetical protein